MFKYEDMFLSGAEAIADHLHTHHDEEVIPGRLFSKVCTCQHKLNQSLSNIRVMVNDFPRLLVWCLFCQI